MSGIQAFAFLILPVAVAIAGWVVALVSNPPKPLILIKQGTAPIPAANPSREHA